MWTCLFFSISLKVFDFIFSFYSCCASMRKCEIPEGNIERQVEKDRQVKDEERFFGFFEFCSFDYSKYWLSDTCIRPSLDLHHPTERTVHRQRCCLTSHPLHQTTPEMVQKREREREREK